MSVKVVRHNMSYKREEVLITKYCNYFSCYEHYTPDVAIKIANKMKEDGVSSFRVYQEYGDTEFQYFRLETEEEAFARVNKEVIEKESHRKFREECLLREAQNLGYKLIKE